MPKINASTILSHWITFTLGVFAGAVWYSYLPTEKRPKPPHEFIKKYATRSWNPKHWAGIEKRSDRVEWVFPVKKIKKKTTIKEYRKIVEYVKSNPKKSVEDVAEHFNISRDKVIDATNANRLGRI